MTERKPADERTADLLEAAERVLERQRSVTVSEVAREAGIASGTFYLYFPSKAHLEATLIERFVADHAERFEREATRLGDVRERMDAAIAEMVRFALDHRALFRLQVAQSPSRETRDELASSTNRIQAILLDTIVAGIGDGVFDVDDPDMTARILYHGVVGVLRGAVGMDTEIDHERLVVAAQSLARKALASPVSRDSVQA